MAWQVPSRQKHSYSPSSLVPRTGPFFRCCHTHHTIYIIIIYYSNTFLVSDVVLEARPWPRRQIFMTVAAGPTAALVLKVQALALALRAALTIFWHHLQMQKR